MDILFEEEGELKALVFDATIRYVATASASVTEHPVERGAAITDHSRAEVETLTADVFVTNKPVVSPNFDGANGRKSGLDLTGATKRDQTRGAQAGQGGQVEAATYETKNVTQSAQVLQFPEPFDRMISVRETLVRICTLGLECTAVTNLGDFPSLLITRVSAPKEASGKVLFTVDFKQVTFVESEIVAVEPLETRAEREARLGARGTEEVETGDVSFAAQLLEGATDIDLIRPARRSGVGIFTR